MWEHFETFSILMKPTYQCFAQPSQGMMLALGKVFFSGPFWGVWLSCGLMCAAITWMLQASFAPQWALMGGLLAVLRYGVFGYWADSYWGGAVGAIGGALVLGSLPRVKESQRPRDAVIMGIGLVLLANSRPFEGFIFSLPVAALLIAWLLGKRRSSFAITLPRVVAPLTAILVLMIAGMGYYLYRVTGSPFRMPYQIERQQYAVAPYMIWQQERPEPAYHHSIMRKMYVEEELVGYRVSRSFPGFLLKLYIGWSFFLGPALTLPVLMLFFSVPRGSGLQDLKGSTWTLLLVFAASAVGWTVESFYNPHYSAPATCIIVAFVLLAMQRLLAWNPSGVFLTRAIVVTCILSFALRAGAARLHIPLRKNFEPAWSDANIPGFGRAAIEKELLQTPGKHLVLVRYDANHEPFEEWVYNDADLDSSRIVWARDMGSDANKGLLEHFNDRQVWMLQPDRHPAELIKNAAPPDSGAFNRTKEQ